MGGVGLWGRVGGVLGGVSGAWEAPGLRVPGSTPPRTPLAAHPLAQLRPPARSASCRLGCGGRGGRCCTTTWRRCTTWARRCCCSTPQSSCCSTSLRWPSSSTPPPSRSTSRASSKTSVRHRHLGPRLPPKLTPAHTHARPHPRPRTPAHAHTCSRPLTPSYARAGDAACRRLDPLVCLCVGCHRHAAAVRGLFRRAGGCGRLLRVQACECGRLQGASVGSQRREGAPVDSRR